MLVLLVANYDHSFIWVLWMFVSCDICSASSFGLVGWTTTATQPRQVVYSSTENWNQASLKLTELVIDIGSRTVEFPSRMHCIPGNRLTHLFSAHLVWKKSPSRRSPSSAPRSLPRCWTRSRQTSPSCPSAPCSSGITFKWSRVSAYLCDASDGLRATTG